MKAACLASTQCQTACIDNEYVHRSHSAVYTLFFKKKKQQLIMFILHTLGWEVTS